MKKIALKNATRGTAFDYAGQSWILLENDDGRALCLSKDIIETRAFDEGNFNNFAVASSKEYLNGAYLDNLLDRYKALVVFDTETSGLDFDSDQIIELAALRVERTATGGLRIAGKMDTFIKLPEGETLPENIVSLTGITDERLQTEGVQPVKAAGQIAKLMQNGPTLMIAHNAQFDACFLRGLLRGQKVGWIDWLDSLTVYKDRRAYPHKLANAIIAYDLTGKVQNSHRAIDDVLALFEVLKAMDDEREDLGSYVNLFGYNPKYGVSGRRIVGVRYEPQSFSKGLTRPEQTLPARVARR